MNDDLSRPVATTDDNEYSLSVDEAAERRACRSPPNDPRDSAILRQRRSGLPPDGNAVRREIRHHAYVRCKAHCLHRGGATGHDRSRPVATNPDESRYVTRLETESQMQIQAALGAEKHGKSSANFSSREPTSFNHTALATLQ